MRTHFINPDFRTDPKTKRFCCVCQRDITGPAATVRLSVEGFMEVIHPDDANDNNSILSVVGSECSKIIPNEFIL